MIFRVTGMVFPPRAALMVTVPAFSKVRDAVHRVHFDDLGDKDLVRY